MPPSTRKRASAFDDFPAEAGQPAAPEAEPAMAAAAPAAPVVERIERLKPSQMLPDRFQPRRLLPSSLRMSFFSGKKDCYQVAAEWLNLSLNDAGVRTETERLLAMGGSFEEHGQIKPITGSWVTSQDGRYIFIIETGERRFWAACLRAVTEKAKEEPLLRVEVVTRPTRQRQVLENRHAEAPSAVSQGCEIAALILAELAILPDPAVPDDYDYFRKARAQRMPAGLWDRLMPVMQLTRPRMVQLLNILQLPTPLLEQADHHRLPERVLREILALPQPQWERTLKASIQNQLTSDDVADLSGIVRQRPAHSRPPATPPEPVGVATSGLRRFANAINNLDEFAQAQAIDEIADILVSTREAEGMVFLLGELGRMVEARLSRRGRV